ncbi:hypothetical protein AMAG_14095 [Allomyces macrogynus ATCC 38327]|uniref:Uncharacterized protein n=1 Tax=Allomyces macrogynus (strain ATCC 38327) TaxID=578462 RepID=A0A0L0T499_ALLM3|nr:hypothetical protein AMAG_14095 [Allomyces macrogynus ATCC 38327]|eukprot:KNE69531.1 hypothetical protein AMAG_14095 [Allomyces macrogynus ATCC 38327]
MVWDQLKQAAEQKGLNEIGLRGRINVAMEVVESVQVALHVKVGELYALAQHAELAGDESTKDIVHRVVNDVTDLLSPGACEMEDRAKMKMALVGVAQSIASVLGTFEIDLTPINITTLVCKVALPLLDAFLMVKALNINWGFVFYQAGTLYALSTMTDDENELEWRLDDDGEVTGVPQGMMDTKVVLLTTVPGIPHQFSEAETVVHHSDARELLAIQLHSLFVKLLVSIAKNAQPLVALRSHVIRQEAHDLTAGFLKAMFQHWQEETVLDWYDKRWLADAVMDVLNNATQDSESAYIAQQYICDNRPLFEIAEEHFKLSSLDSCVSFDWKVAYLRNVYSWYHLFASAKLIQQSATQGRVQGTMTMTSGQFF